MELKEIEYNGFGRCVRITNGMIDCIVTIEAGPRIVHFGFSGEKNVLYVDSERKYKRMNQEPSSPPGKNSFYYLYGGHRLQICQTPQLYFPDNSPVVYSVQTDGVTFTPPTQKQNKIQFSYEIMMGQEASDIMIVHTATNCSRETIILGLLPATMLICGGIAVVPQFQEVQNNRPDRTINFWPGTNMQDQRIFYGNKFLTIRQEPGNEEPLQIGTNNLQGWIAYAGESFTLFKRFVANPQSAYPDSGSSCEIRMTADFAELCSLSPVYQIKPGETIKHVENISIYPGGNPPIFTNEKEIEDWVNEF